MTLRPVQLLPLAACLALVSCSLLGSDKEKKQEEQVQEAKQKLMMEKLEESKHLGNPLLANGSDAEGVNYNVSTSEELEKIDNGAEGEVFFTNPDDPDADIEGITEAFESRRNGNGWMGDYAAAVRFARQENRPLLIWFHDSVLSPRSGELGEHLLDTPEFNAFCKDRVVRLKLDSGIAIDDKTRDTAKYSIETIRRLAMRYGLRKRPAFAIVSPYGGLVRGLDGYSGFVQEVDSEIRGGVEQCEEELRANRAKLAAKGYREWHAAKNANKVFAKVQRLDDATGRVYLKKEGGRISRTKVSNLSKADQEYLEQYRKENAGKKKKAGKE